MGQVFAGKAGSPTGALANYSELSHQIIMLQVRSKHGLMVSHKQASVQQHTEQGHQADPIAQSHPRRQPWRQQCGKSAKFES